MFLVGRLVRATQNVISRERLRRKPIESGLGDSAWLLHGLVRSMKPTVCVEIGSARGKSACFIAQGLRDNDHGKLYAIDPHEQTAWNDFDSVDTFGEITQNLAQLNLSRWVDIVRKKSQDAAEGWERKIDLLFIDGDHGYEGVKQDWELFSPHVSQFGVVIFHDTLWDLRPDPTLGRSDMGVPRFVEELREVGYPVMTFEKDFGVSLVQPVRGGIALSSKTALQPSGV